MPSMLVGIMPSATMNPIADALSNRFGGASVTIWTFGHSTRSFEEFLALLKENQIELLVDVRHFPTSQRVPWATKASLTTSLRDRGIEYQHFVELGGYRKALPNSVNTGWRSSGFRGYADYMATPAFAGAVDQLITLATAKRTAIMCAEAVPWKCHRSLLSDSLVARGVRVIHILSAGKTQEHRLTPFARIHGTQVTYPAAHKGA